MLSSSILDDAIVFGHTQTAFKTKLLLDGSRISRNTVKNLAYLKWLFIWNYHSRQCVIINEESNVPDKVCVRDITVTPQPNSLNFTFCFARKAKWGVQIGPFSFYNQDCATVQFLPPNPLFATLFFALTVAFYNFSHFLFVSALFDSPPTSRSCQTLEVPSRVPL